jgi:hypothetical protein
MANGLNTSTTEANVIATVISRARDVIEKPLVMTDANVVTKVTIEDGDGLTYNWPKFGTGLTAQSLLEGQPINNPQTLIPSTQQFTTSENGVQVILTDKAKRVTKEAMAARAGRFMGNAMRRLKETTGLALFSGLSRDLGTANNAFNPGFLSAAKVRLKAAAESGQSEPAEGEIVAILHNFHVHDILTSSATLGNNQNVLASGYQPIEGWTEELVREYDIRRLYGVDIAQAPLISIDGSDDAIGAVFSKLAFIYVGTSHSMKMEKDRDIELRADMMVLTSEYGFGELEDQFGFKITADATAPAA